jgi:hypothetical protein
MAHKSTYNDLITLTAFFCLINTDVSSCYRRISQTHFKENPELQKQREKISGFLSGLQEGKYLKTGSRLVQLRQEIFNSYLNKDGASLSTEWRGFTLGIRRFYIELLNVKGKYFALCSRLVADSSKGSFTEAKRDFEVSIAQTHKLFETLKLSTGPL